MNLSCSSKMIKYLMFAFNLFFVISGIIIIAVGVSVKSVYSEYSDFLDSKYFSLPNMLIATGALIFFISFFGCCGAVRESWIMLGVFSILLCIIFLFEFSAGIAGYVLRGRTISFLETTLKDNLGTYTKSTHAIWDSIQNGFHCCGVNNYTDWSGTFPDKFALPVSCCPAVTGNVGAFYCNFYETTTSEGTTLAPTNPPSTKAPTVTSPTTQSPTTTSPTTQSPTTTSPTTTPASTASSPATSTTDNTTTTEKPSNLTQNEVRQKRELGDNLNNESSTTTTTPNPSSSKPYLTGCKTAFGSYIRKHAVQIGGWALGLAIIQILGIAFSCHLVRQLKNGYYST